MKKPLETLAIIHMGNYQNSMVINDDCPACKWSPPDSADSSGAPLNPEAIKQLKPSGSEGDPMVPGPDDPDWRLGMIWAPGVERGCGALFQIFLCQKCGLVYATHVN